MATYAAIYARTSSPNQKYNYSIQEQIDQCFSFCDSRGWVTNYVFIDECQSGKNIDRPKFQLMLEKAQTKCFDVIICWKLDRFCRSLVDLVNTERKLSSWEVNLCSVTEYIDTTTPVGRFNFRNLASVAEFEREIIGQRARMGLHALAKQHKWANSHPPLGYDKDNNGKLMINIKEKNLIIYIFELYIEKKSMPQVAFELNQQNFLTKKENAWNARAVRDILTNELYIGIYSVAGFQDHVKEYRLLEDQLFSNAKKIRLRYKKRPRKQIPKGRRKEKVEKIFNEYLEVIERMECVYND